MKKQAGKFENVNGDEKQNTRDTIETNISNSGVIGGTVGCLPFIQCRMEIQLLDNVSRKFRFIGCEYKESYFRKLKATIVNENLSKYITPQFGKLEKLIYNSEPNTFTHFIADYCGQFHKVANEIKHLIENNLVQVGGTIHITFNKRFNSKKFYNDMNDLYPNPCPETVCLCEHAVTTFLNNAGNFRYRLITRKSYTDKKSNGKRGAHMMLIGLQRVK